MGSEPYHEEDAFPELVARSAFLKKRDARRAAQKMNVVCNILTEILEDRGFYYECTSCGLFDGLDEKRNQRCIRALCDRCRMAEERERLEDEEKHGRILKACMALVPRQRFKMPG